MQIPGLGTVTKDSKFDWYYSKPMRVPVLGDKKRRVVVEGYDEDRNKDEFHAAIAHFLSLDSSALKHAEPHVFQYYKDSRENQDPDDEEFPSIKSPGDVWPHVRFGDEPTVMRRANGDKGIYISLECGCDWEAEHGLQIVFKNGLKVNKVGPYDGHLTNSDAYADSRLEDVIYR